MTKTLPSQCDVAIIGGGLAGLCAAIHLAKRGREVVLLERRQYPFHRVCGEYVSCEVLPYLRWLGYDPYEDGAARISRLELTTPGGGAIQAALPLGGFGISRYRLDSALAALAACSGVQLFTSTRVNDVTPLSDGSVELHTQGGGQMQALTCAGSWGKRDALDKRLDRVFIQERTGFMGVKYHLRGTFPEDLISLHLFPGGYCGHSAIEGQGLFNLCYLYQRRGSPVSIEELEEKYLMQNPALKSVLQKSERVFNAPEVINEISFAPKKPTAAGMLLCGDAAGLITPLCGNGMAMAIRGGKLTAEAILRAGRKPNLMTSKAMIRDYEHAWKKNFGQRLWWGRALQRAFYSKPLLALGLGALNAFPFAKPWLIRQTHGKVMKEQDGS